MYVSSILQRMLARNQKKDRSSIFHYIGVVLPYLTSMAVRQGVTLTSSYKSYTWSSFLTGSGHVREGTVLTIQVNRILICGEEMHNSNIDTFAMQVKVVEERNEYPSCTMFYAEEMAQEMSFCLLSSTSSISLPNSLYLLVLPHLPHHHLLRNYPQILHWFPLLPIKFNDEKDI